MTAPPGGDVGVLEGRGDQRSELPLMKRSPSAARSLAADGAPKRGGGSGGSQRSLDIGGQPTRRTPSAESQRRRNKEGGGSGPDGQPQAAAGRIKASSSETWLRHVASDGNVSHVVQLEREMATELAQNAADVAEVPGPRHVKYATVMAKNLRRDSQRASTPELGQGGANARMTQDERRELARVQREVMWNLQKDEVVTIVCQGDEPVPYKRQGNPAVNTPISVRKRLALRNKPLIQEIINEYWCFPGLNPEGSGEMTKESYVKLNRKLHLALIPDTSDEDTETSAEVDWSRDTARWDGKMSKAAFASSMFELADIWTENINEEEYTAFLWLLLETITNTNVVPPSFKPDKEIECIVDEDLSEAANRMRDAIADELGRERDSLPLDVDGITALLADKTGRRDTLSPQLKDKYIQRLRTLRRRLQALKELRKWSALEAAVGTENNTSEGGETSKWAASMEGGGASNASEDFKTITPDSGSTRQSSANILGGMPAEIDGTHANAVDAEPLGSAVRSGNSTLERGHHISGGGGGDVDGGGGAVRDGRARSVGRSTMEQQLNQGEESARSVKNLDGEGRQQANGLPQPSRSGALAPGSDESGSKPSAGRLSTGGGPEESVGVSQLGKTSGGALDLGRDSPPKGKALGNDSGGNTRVGREDGGMTADDTPSPGAGGTSSGGGIAETRASHATDIGDTQGKTQQQRSNSAADDRGNRAAAGAGPGPDTTTSSALKRQQEGDQFPPQGTDEEGMGKNSSSKRGEVGDDNESGKGGRSDADDRESADTPRVEHEDNHSGGIVKTEVESGGVSGDGATAELKDIEGSGGEGSAGYARNAGLASRRRENGDIGADDMNVTVTHDGETQSADGAGSGNSGDGRPAGGDHEHSPSSASGVGNGEATSAQSAATAGVSEGVAAIAGYSGDMNRVMRGGIDDVQKSSGNVTNEDVTENPRHIGTGATPYGGAGNTNGVLRESGDADNYTAPIDPGSGKHAGVGGTGRRGDTGDEQPNAAQTSPERVEAAEHQRDGDGGGGRGNHHGRELAPTLPKMSKRTSDSDQNSESVSVKPGGPEHGGSSAIASIADREPRQTQSEDNAERKRGDVEEAGGTAAEPGDSGWRKRVSFDVEGPGASSTPTRPSLATNAMLFHPNPGGSPGGSPSGWDGISGTTDEQWESMIGRAEIEKQQRASMSVAGRAPSASPSGPGVENPPTGYTPPSTTIDQSGPAGTEEETEAVAAAPGHSTETQEGLPDVGDHAKGDLGDRQGSVSSGRPNFKRKTRLNSLEAGDRPGLEPHSGHGGNSDSKSDGGGRGGREDLPTLGDGKASDLSPSARDPTMKLETTVLNESEGTPRQPDLEREFDREQVEGRISDHALPEYGTGNGDNDGLSSRPGEEGEDTSSMARRSHVGDETAEAHARKVSTSFTERQVVTRAEVEGFLGPSAVSEGIPAHFQPVPDDHNTPSRDSLDGDSMAPKPQSASPVATPDDPADTGGVNGHHALPHPSTAAGGSAFGGDDPSRTDTAASLTDVGKNNSQNRNATDGSTNGEGGETRFTPHPGAYDTAIARTEEGRQSLGSWSARDHESGKVSSNVVDNKEVPSGDDPTARLATHTDGQLAPVTDTVIDYEKSRLQNRIPQPEPQNRVSKPDSTANASGGVGAVPRLALGDTSFGGVGSERAGVESDTEDDRSAVEELTERPPHSHRDDTHAGEYGMGGDVSHLNVLSSSSAEGVQNPRSGGKKVTHIARRSGVNSIGGGSGGAANFGADQPFEAVGVSVRSRMDQGSGGVKSRTDQGGDAGGSHHLDNSRRQRARPSDIPGRAQTWRRKSDSVTGNNVAPEKSEGQSDGQGVHRHASTGSVRRHDGPDQQQHRGIVPETDAPVDPSKRVVYREVFKAGQVKENYETKGRHEAKGSYKRPGAIAGSRVGETSKNRRPQQTSTTATSATAAAAAAAVVVGERHPRPPLRPGIEGSHAVHPRISNNDMAGNGLDEDGKIYAYDVNAAEGNGTARARAVRVAVLAKEVDEDPRQRILGPKVMATLPTGGSILHKKMGSTAVAEPAMGVTGRMPKGGGAAAGEPATGAATGVTPKGGGTVPGEPGQSISTSEEGTPRIPPNQSALPTTVRPTRHRRISREPYAKTGDASLDARRPQREQRRPEFRAGSLSTSSSVETSAPPAGSLDDCITRGKGNPRRAVLGRQDRANNREHPRRSGYDVNTNKHRGNLSARDGAHREAVPDHLHPPFSARGEQYSSRGAGGGKWNAAYHEDTSRPEHYDGRDGSMAGNNSEGNGRLPFGTKKRISPRANDSPRDATGIVSSSESLKTRRAPAPPDSGGRWDDPAYRTEPKGEAATRGAGRKGLGEEEEAIYMTARSYHAEPTFRHSRLRGGPSQEATEITTATQPADNNGIGSHWGYAQTSRDDRPEAEQRPLGDRSNRPPRRNPVRPRTTPVSVNPQQHDDQQKLRRMRDLNRSDRKRGRSGSLHDREVVAGPPAQPHQDRRTSFSSGRQHGNRPEDWRPMLGQLEAPQWGRPWQQASASDVSVRQEESLPYYVDRKQVWQFFPDLGLPPWRTPAPGEPGWDPILNYCEVKQDEDKITEDRKRREYLCQKRTQSRGGDWSTPTGGSSLEGCNSSHDSDTPRVLVRKRTSASVVPRKGGGRKEEQEKGYDEGVGDAGSARIAVARNLNVRKPPPTPAATTAAAAEARHGGKNVYFHDPPGLVADGGGVQNPAPKSNLRRFKTLVRGNGHTRTPVSVQEVVGDRYRREHSSTGALVAGRLRANSALTSSHFLRPLMGASEATSPNAETADFLPPGHVHCTSAFAPPKVVEGRPAAPVGKRYRRRRMPLGGVADSCPPDTNLAGIISRYRQGGSFYLPTHAKAAQAGAYTYLPSQAKALQAAALDGGYKHRRRTDYSPTRVLYAPGAAPRAYSSAITGAPTFAPPSSRYTNVGGSRWSQDVRLQQHARGRSRLAPSTRTAGGRWGANHGRLEALFPWEESPPHPPDWERWQNGPWVLDLDPSLC